MTTKLRRAIILASASLMLTPASARADGLISWLDKLSGPGPWIGVNLNVCVWRQEMPTDPAELESVLVTCKRNLNEPHWSVYTNAGVAFALANDLNYQGQDIAGKSGGVRLFKAGTSAMYTVHPAVDLGFGGGFMVFWGDRFSRFTRPYVQPFKVAMRPLLFPRRRRAGQSPQESTGPELERRAWLVLSADWTLLPGTIDGSAFGAPADPLRATNEFIPQFGIWIDLRRLF